MEKLIASVLLSACVCIGLVLASSHRMLSSVPSAVDAVEQIERDLGEAIVAADIGKLDQILADDWQSTGMSGKTYTKECILRDLKSGRDKLESFELGPMDVQVFGNVAVGHGSITEKRSSDGKDTSGEFVWMDLLQKRDGK